MTTKPARGTAVRGTADILPDEIHRWRMVEETARSVFEQYGFGEIRTPIFEQTDVFARGVGMYTDIVEKEAYTFQDKKGRDLMLRPEATAAVVRAYLERKLDIHGGLVKYYYIGPMFRYGRPQAGRFRQFHQIGIEAIGSYHPAVDAECLAMLYSLMVVLTLEDTIIEINSVGCPKCRPNYTMLLKNELTDIKRDLCHDCLHRYERNPLRILDCKNSTCRIILRKMPLLSDLLCEECMIHFSKFREYLEILHVPYKVNGHLVRGLDYYTKTVYEVLHPYTGEQDAIGGGGRYDHLVESMGGKQQGATGFALGIERLILAQGKIGYDESSEKLNEIYLISRGDEAFSRNFALLNILRHIGLRAEMNLEAKSLKAQLRAANRLGVKLALIRGEEEVDKDMVRLKEMVEGEEKLIPEDRIIEVMEDLFNLKERTIDV